MTYTIENIAQILNGKFFQNPNPHTGVEHLLIDSRQVAFAHSSLFFALESGRRDGHSFIQDAYEKGVRNFIISKNISFSDFPEGNFIMVGNTLQALQELARFHRTSFDLPIIGITGSNGKTMVKEWLFQLLNPDYNIVRSPKSFNSQIGVPLSVWQIEKHHTLGIFEAGISEMGEMEKIASIINCTLGVFTNIGTAHSSGFPDLETKMEEKSKLFHNAQELVYTIDDPIVDGVMAANYPDREEVSLWSTHDEMAGLYVQRIKKIGNRTKISASYFDEPVHIYVPFTDDISIENAIHCWTVMLHLDYENSTIQQRMLHLHPLEMRLEVKEGINGCTIINDAYNADLSAFNMSLNFLKQQAAGQKKILIISDFYETGKTNEELYEIVADAINEYKIETIICIGEAVQQLKFEITGDISYFNSTAEFLQQFNEKDFVNKTVLLKGARLFHFEKIANRLSKKVHKTLLEVNLSALQHNLRTYSNLLHSGTKMMIMVKASAYGIGAVEVAKHLEFSGVNYLAVAYADEGIELRKAGVQLPIMVLNPEEDSFFELTVFDLEPEISNFDLFQKYSDYLTKQVMVNFPEIPESNLPPFFTDLMDMFKSEFDPTNPFPIHLKLDTGMHRLGFERKDLLRLQRFLKEAKHFKVKSILSHLAASETSDHDKFTNQQIDQYLKMYEEVVEALDYRPMRHILNSGGIVRFPEYQMDMVRLGIGLYGIDSSGLIQKDLQTVNTLKATVSQIKTVEAGETVSYGRTGVAEHDMKIATISVGYADGLPRAAGNGIFRVEINGQKAPIFGTVCMDMCMIDVTDLDNVKQGDMVTIFGKSPKVEDLAAAVGTIPYEIYTGVSNRVKRVYFQE